MPYAMNRHGSSFMTQSVDAVYYVFLPPAQKKILNLFKPFGPLGNPRRYSSTIEYTECCLIPTAESNKGHKKSQKTGKATENLPLGQYSDI